MAALVLVALGMIALRVVGPGSGAGRVDPSPNTAAPSIDIEPVPPLELGETFLCPPAAPISAFASPRVAYQPNHPRLPPHTKRPVACFPSMTVAVLAGYPQAAPPPGAEYVNGVFLVPAGRLLSLFDQCDRAARLVGFRVPCPSLLPNPARGAPGPRCGRQSVTGFGPQPPCVLERRVCPSTGCERTSAFSLEYAGFAVPPGFLSASEGSLLVIQGIPSSLLHLDDELAFLFACESGKTVDRVEIPMRFAAAVAAEFRSCTEGPLSGMLLVRWSEGAVVYQVGLRAGDRPNIRSLLVEIVASIQLFPTPGP